MNSFLSVATECKKHFYPLRWAVALGPITKRLSGLREGLSRWTEAHSHGFSKDPTVPTRVLKKNQHQAILGSDSSFSGWLRPLWNYRNDHLPTHHPSPHPLAGFSGNRRRQLSPSSTADAATKLGQDHFGIRAKWARTTLKFMHLQASTLARRTSFAVPRTAST